MTSIQSILQQRGPSLSSEIVSLLMEKDGISSEAARKRISRAQNPVEKLRDVNLPNRELFLYLDDDFGTNEFYNSLVEAFKVTNSAYGRALTGLQARGGIMRREYFPIASGLCTDPIKKQLLHGDVEKTLINLGVLRIQSTPKGDLIALRGYRKFSSKREAILIVESVVLSLMRTWLTKTGMSSYNVTKIREENGGELPSFGPFKWDLTGPSYLTGLVDIAKSRDELKPQLKPGFIAGDIIFDTVSKEDISPFLAKCNVIRNQPTQRRFIPLFIADFYDPPAMDELRKNGCLLARPEVIFGEEAARLLRELVETLGNAATAVTNHPGKVFELMKKLGKIEGAALNLRGVLFEFIVARLCSLEGYNIRIRQGALAGGNRAEIDVMADRPDEVVCIECKGKSPGNLVEDYEINDWVSKSLPTIKNWLKEKDLLPNQKRFEFYVSTDYTNDAKTEIARLESKHKKQPIKFFNGSDLIEKLREMDQTSLIEVYREHFIAV